MGKRPHTTIRALQAMQDHLGGSRGHTASTAAAQSEKRVQSGHRSPGKRANLGHDAIVGSNHQDDDVGDRCAPGAHSGEGSMTRGVQECSCGLWHHNTLHVTPDCPQITPNITPTRIIRARVPPWIPASDLSMAIVSATLRRESCSQMDSMQAPTSSRVIRHTAIALRRTKKTANWDLKASHAAEALSAALTETMAP